MTEIQRARNRDGTRILQGFLPGRYDQIDLTYNASGDIATVLFTDLGVALVKLYLTYNASGDLTRVICKDQNG